VNGKHDRCLPAWSLLKVFVFSMAQQPLVGQGRRLIVEASRSHAVKHATLCRTPLDEWSARHRDIYLRTHNTHKRQTSMPLAIFEPTIPASQRLL
jgi:hypothetical protein